MHKKKYMTAREVSERWNGAISPRTLANWRSCSKGPPFVKFGGVVGSVRGGGVISGGAFGGHGGGESAAFLARASVGTGTV